MEKWKLWVLHPDNNTSNILREKEIRTKRSDNVKEVKKKSKNFRNNAPPGLQRDWKYNGNRVCFYLKVITLTLKMGENTGYRVVQSTW
jgi:hypothetical protein